MRLTLFGEESVFFRRAGRAQAHYLVPTGNQEDWGCTLFFMMTDYFWFDLPCRVWLFSKKSRMPTKVPFLCGLLSPVSFFPALRLPKAWYM